MVRDRNRKILRLCEDDGGFSLVEMLVVLVLTAFMAGMMTVGLHQMRTWTQLHKKESAQLTLEAVADYISGELSGALVLPLLGYSNEDFTPLVGSPNSVRFVAVIRTGFAVKTLRDVSFLIEKMMNENILVRKSNQRLLLKDDDHPTEQSEELYRGILDIKFRFLTQTVQNENVWLDTWTNQPKLPDAIYMEISAKTKDFSLVSARTITLN